MQQVPRTALPVAPALPPLLLGAGPARLVGLVLVAVGFSAASLALLADYVFGGAAGFGPAQLAVLSVGGMMMLAGTVLLLPAGERLPVTVLMPVAQWLDDLLRFLPVVAEVGAVVLVLRWFHVESPVFYERIVLLTFAGFVLHHLLPARLRLGFFTLLSLAGIVLVFGWAGGAWLIAIGVGLMAICHLPLVFGARVLLLIAAGALLAGMRAELLPSTVPAPVWPILGSMFMFRLILYMYELRHAREPMGATRTVAYFFLLPNVAFPLFPVVDFATFRRTYYDRDALMIYRAGVRWMLIGVTHLLLYRAVYQYLTIPAADVTSGAQLARYMVATFLLYLKVSGQFHLIVGMLHLFGFRLPESHRFFYLAASFTDFWRRINIYWKDFMMKVFYYPVYFRVRGRGDTFALVVSTVLVFFATWALHSYQWFWLLGSVLLSWPDALFWAILAGLLVVNSLRENRHGRKRRLGAGIPEPAESVRYGIGVAATFTTLCLLWSLWSSHTVGDWLGLWARAALGPGALAAALSVLAAAVLALAAGHQLAARSQALHAAAKKPRAPRLAVNAAWLVILFLAGSPVLSSRMGLAASEFTRDLRVDKLNRSDATLLHRGYYENLTSVNQFNSRLWEAYAKRPADWRAIWNTEVVRRTDDFLKWEVAPLVGTVFNGATLRTNRWGMRDRDYELVAPPGTFRMALAGASFVMGVGVNDHETFEQLVEERLNDEFADANGGSFEILNFGVPAYTPVEQLLLLETKIFNFRPAVFMLVGHPYDAQNSSRHVAKVFLEGVPMPYPFLDELVAQAGLRRGMSLDEAAERLWEPSTRRALVYWSLQRIAELCRERGVHPVWVFVTTPEVAVPDSDIMLLFDAARDAGFTIIDLSDAYGDLTDAELSVAPWDAHPNALGHRLIADRLYRALTAEGNLSRLNAARQAVSEEGG